MKIGLSFSRCVRDIVEGRVDMNNVLVIIARTDFDPGIDEQWLNIWQRYTERNGWSPAEWADYTDTDQELFRQVSLDLYRGGKLHQPRKFGIRAQGFPYHWLEAVLPDTELTKFPAVRDAWDRFNVVAGLTGVKLDPNFNSFS